MRRLRERITDVYFTVDTRSLGLFRIAFGFVLLSDLCKRAQVLEWFYTNDGLLPNHTLLWAPPARRMFSILFSASSPGEARFFMLLAGLFFSAFLVGYRTKLAQILSLIALVSLNTRLAPLENGGDMVMNILCVWTLFLPLGERFSVDAVLRSLRARKENTPEELGERGAMHVAAGSYRSLAVLALILQFFFIYYFNVVHKNGETWLTGTAVHYTLHQDRLITAFGVWLRESVPFPVLRALTYGAMVVEALGAFAIINPFFHKYTRLLAVLLLPALHLGFELCLDLGVFSYAMMSFFPLLLLPVHWEWLRARLSPLHRERLVFFDAGCGICFALARLLCRLDGFGKLSLVSNAQAERLPQGVSAELTDTTIVVADAKSGKTSTKAAALRALLGSLPLGPLFAWPLAVPGIEQLVNLLYELVARHRTRISTWFGKAACGLPRAHEASPQMQGVTPARAALRRYGKITKELAILLVMVAVCGELLNSNAAVPRWMRYSQPAFLQAVIEYPRLLQGWRMFAPHAPIEDFAIEIDAITKDGRHVDPYNQVASRYPGPGFTEIPPQLGQAQFFTAYSLFIWRPHFRPYLTAFQEWVLRYHKRTGRPEDRIVSFTAYKLSDLSPPPGQTKPTSFKREVFFRYPDPKR